MLFNFVDATNDANHYTKPPHGTLQTHYQWQPWSTKQMLLHNRLNRHTDSWISITFHWHVNIFSLQMQVTDLIPWQWRSGLFECNFLLSSMSFTCFLSEFVQQTVTPWHFRDFKRWTTTTGNNWCVRAVEAEWRTLDLAPRHEWWCIHACQCNT